MNTTLGNGNRNGHNSGNHNIVRDIARVLAGTALLLVPLAAMQFSADMAWTLSDFVTAGLLLSLTGISYVLLASQARTTGQRLLVGAILGCVLLTIWAELAVGLFH